MTIALKRMRLKSHAKIKRLIDFHHQRQRQLTKTFDKKRTCRYNARSAFLLCAVNPSGPCQTCQHYETSTPPESCQQANTDL